MTIVYIGYGSSDTTSGHRASALGRLGHTVNIWDPLEVIGHLRGRGILRKIHDTSGQILLTSLVCRWLTTKLEGCSAVDCVWVNGGEFLSPKSLRMLASVAVPKVLYNNDDPTGKRDGNRFWQVRRSLPFYDMFVALRSPTAQEGKQLGAKRVFRVHFSYDEVFHAPLTLDEPLGRDFVSDVCFVGTWMRDECRDEFIHMLWRSGLNISIWGPRWEKSRFKDLVKACWRGPWISGRQYVQTISGAKIALGMVSKGNRDEHTQRSVEIPYAGGLLCAERTSEHMRMFKEGEEAVFWSSPEECIRVCRDLLANEDRRREIVANGMRKVRELKVGNEDVCRRILRGVFADAQ